MTQNKIPTDEEIFEEWRRTNGGIISDPENVWVECAGDSWIELIHLARAAGREEQREQVRLALEKSCECCQCPHENCFSYIQEAIRAEEKKG